MQAYHSRQLFPALMATWLSGGAVLADEPPRPPEDKTVCSPNGAACAEMDAEARHTTVSKNGAVVWSMPGWFRDAYLADDGEHFVVGNDGRTLIPDRRPDRKVVAFWRRDRLLREVALSDVIEDFSALTPTVSHFLWGHAVGFDERGRFLVHTVEDRVLAFEVESGALMETWHEPYPSG